MNWLKKAWKYIVASYLWIAILVVIADFASKWIVQANLKLGESIAVIPNFFYITLSHNTGAAFSMGADWPYPWGRVAGIAVSAIMSVLIAWYWLKNLDKNGKIMNIILALLEGGAVGNLIDRALYWKGTFGFDGVIDFLQFYLGGGPEAPYSAINPFAIFNIADSALTIGVIVLIVVLAYEAIMEDKKKNSADPRKEPQEDGKESN